jgi:hypothetical protein
MVSNLVVYQLALIALVWLFLRNYPGRLRGPMQSAFTAFLRKG